jgi:hypothetical protein
MEATPVYPDYNQSCASVLNRRRGIAPPPYLAIVRPISIFDSSDVTIQALDRTQPGLPLKRGRSQTMTHDYKRNGTATLFAALNAANGEVYGFCQEPALPTFWRKSNAPAASCINVNLHDALH